MQFAKEREKPIKNKLLYAYLFEIKSKYLDKIIKSMQKQYSTTYNIYSTRNEIINPKLIKNEESNNLGNKIIGLLM